MRDRPAFDLFLISWLVLFLELACIRWFPSHVLFLTFFTNTVLLASFVGMSIGCLVARSPTRFIRHTPVWLCIGIVGGLVINMNSPYLSKVFAVGNQLNPDVVYFGTETSVTADEKPPFTIPIELVGGLFFALIAAILVGPGQEMGRAFNRVTDRTRAYSANLLGSLVGIGMFAASSYLRMPPIVWFTLIGLVLAYLLVRKDPDSAGATAMTSGGSRRPVVPLAFLVAAVLLTTLTSGLFPGPGQSQTIWSPYYRIDYYPKARYINTNLISQQVMEPTDDPPQAKVPYALPLLFQRDLLKPDGTHYWPEFKRILIIGAGNGNDVARVLRFAPPDAWIDAVEIDPVIQELGDKHHPDHPFQDKRVHVHLNDGRNFLRDSPPETYDLVEFALIDSLVLQSGYSNLRLESYLFTLESFKDVHRVLKKKTGVYAVYNFFRQGWIAARIREALRTAFEGVDPVMITTPPRAHVALDLFEPGGSTGFFAGSADVIDPLRAEFAKSEFYWYPWFTGVPKDTKARFGKTPPTEPPPAATHPLKEHGKVIAPEWIGLRPTIIEESKGSLRTADDNWPFLYARTPSIPGLTWRGVALTLLLSIGLWMAFGGREALGGTGSSPDWGSMLRSFFLGAGFMLVETKAVVEMALLFGGTWMVNTVVFAAILVMSLAGNLFAGQVKPKRLEPYYVGLALALVVGLSVPPSTFLGLSPTLQILGACAVVFAPIAFAGVIFATSFRRTTQPDRMFGANIAGALVGGLSENTSVILGFQLLLCVAAGFYFLSAVFGNRELPASAAEKSV